MKRFYAVLIHWQWLLVPALMLGQAGMASAQQPTKRTNVAAETPTNPPLLQSDLAKDNLDRVAASPGQIKEVLIRDSGLLVELKRWIAKEASDNGQLVNDEDLIDTAVFDRLTTDVAFRSAATRLLQRYGYLLPTVNPDSEMGKEQDLLLKRRVSRQLQIEAQQDSEAIKPATPETNERKVAACDLNDDRDCMQGAPTQTERSIGTSNGNIPQGEPLFDYPNEAQPLPTPSIQGIMQTGVNQGGMQFGGATGGGLSMQNTSNPMNQQGDPRLNGNMSSDQQSYGTPDQMSAGTMGGGSATGATAGASTSGIGNRSDTGFIGLPRRQPRLAKDRDLAPPATVRRPNPYADIPSLYDLYAQATNSDRPPQRFGTDIFRDGLRDPRTVPMDLPVGPDYVVGPGDSLAISLWGGVSTKLLRVVDRQGRVTLPEAGPLLVSGRSLGAVQEDVQKAIGTQYRDTSAAVSLSRLRTVRVYVMGEVEEPGAYDISSLSTALNALVAAGGATPRGSLRTLKHIRGRTELEEIDAYDLLLHGVSPDALRLQSGDTLMVPPLGPQVTVTGMVRRPAIYELHGEKTVEDVLELAGGILPAAALRHVEVERLEAHEKRTMMSLDLSPDNTAAAAQLDSFVIRDGDEIHIFPIASYNQDTVYLQGHVLRPGRYSYHDGMKLSDIIASYKDVLPEPAAHYAEIIRLNPPDFHPSVVSFDLSAAMTDQTTAPQLQPLDTVRIFSRFDFEPPPTVSVVGEVRSPGNYRTSGQASLRDAVYLAGGLTPDAALDSAQVFRLNADGSSKVFSVSLGRALKGGTEDNILLEPRDRLLIHRNTSRVEPATIEITGEVAKPGRYPYTENMRAEDLIRAAGGLKRSADTHMADLTRYAASSGSSARMQISLASLQNGNVTEDVPLHSGDVLAIRQVAGWSDVGAAVKVGGEVMHPSTYGIQPGERLSSLLERAGGYTKEAYPYGAVLMRREVRDMETRNQTELLLRLKGERAHLTSLPEGDNDQRNSKLNAIAQTDSTLGQLVTNPPIGRVVIHIASDVNRWKNTTTDVPLRDGDELIIPKKSAVVIVNGQVFNPTAISAQPGRSAKWYLSQAGGLTPIADKKAAFVIRADGSVISARNNGAGFWSGDPLNVALRPGDTVIVPERTPKIGGVNWTTIMQTAQVASSVALAVAYIHP